MVLDYESIQRSVFCQQSRGGGGGGGGGGGSGSGLVSASFPYQGLQLSGNTSSSSGAPSSTKKNAMPSYEKTTPVGLPPSNGGGGGGGDFPFDFDAFLSLYATSAGGESTTKQLAAAESQFHVFPVTKAPDVPSRAEAEQARHNHNNAVAPDEGGVVEVCPDPNCPHCLAIDFLLQQSGGDGGSPAATASPPASFAEAVASPLSHMDVSHGTPSTSVGVPSPSGPTNLSESWSPQIFEMTGTDALQGLFSAWPPGNGAAEEKPATEDPPSIQSKWKSESLLLKDSVGGGGSPDRMHQQRGGGGGGGNPSMQLVQVLTSMSPPPPAYKLGESEPPIRDKVAAPAAAAAAGDRKAFGSNLIHLGNGMSLMEREVVDMPVHELNRLLYQSKLTEAEISLIKETRRRGKNKVAARNCRKRKMDTISELEKEVDDLKVKKEKLADERDLLAKELEVYKSKTESLTRFILEKVKYGSGLKLNIGQLALDKAEDGRLFIIPDLECSSSIAGGDCRDDGHLAVIA